MSLVDKQNEWSDLLAEERLVGKREPPHEGLFENLGTWERFELAAVWVSDAIQAIQVDFPRSPLQVKMYSLSRNTLFNIFADFIICLQCISTLVEPSYCPYPDSLAADQRLRLWHRDAPTHFAAMLFDLLCVLLNIFDISLKVAVDRENYSPLSAPWTTFRAVVSFLIVAEFIRYLAGFQHYRLVRAFYPFLLIARRINLRHMFRGFLTSTYYSLTIIKALFCILLTWGFMGFLLFRRIDTGNGLFSTWGRGAATALHCFTSRPYKLRALSPIYEHSQAASVWFLTLSLAADILCIALIVAVGAKYYKQYAADVLYKRLVDRRHATTCAFAAIKSDPKVDRVTREEWRTLCSFLTSEYQPSDYTANFIFDFVLTTAPERSSGDNDSNISVDVDDTDHAAKAATSEIDSRILSPPQHIVAEDTDSEESVEKTLDLYLFFRCVALVANHFQVEILDEHDEEEEEEEDNVEHEEPMFSAEELPNDTSPADENVSNGPQQQSLDLNIELPSTDRKVDIVNEECEQQLDLSEQQILRRRSGESTGKDSNNVADRQQTPGSPGLQTMRKMFAYGNKGRSSARLAHFPSSKESLQLSVATVAGGQDHSVSDALSHSREEVQLFDSVRLAQTPMRNYSARKRFGSNWSPDKRFMVASGTSQGFSTEAPASPGTSSSPVPPRSLHKSRRNSIHLGDSTRRKSLGGSPDVGRKIMRTHSLDDEMIFSTVPTSPRVQVVSIKTSGCNSTNHALVRAVESGSSGKLPMVLVDSDANRIVLRRRISSKADEVNKVGSEQAIGSSMLISPPKPRFSGGQRMRQDIDWTVSQLVASNERVTLMDRFIRYTEDLRTYFGTITDLCIWIVTAEIEFDTGRTFNMIFESRNNSKLVLFDAYLVLQHICMMIILAALTEQHRDPLAFIFAWILEGLYFLHMLIKFIAVGAAKFLSFYENFITFGTNILALSFLGALTAEVSRHGSDYRPTAAMIWYLLVQVYRLMRIFFVVNDVKIFDHIMPVLIRTTYIYFSIVYFFAVFAQAFFCDELDEEAASNTQFINDASSWVPFSNIENFSTLLQSIYTLFLLSFLSNWSNVMSAAVASDADYGAGAYIFFYTYRLITTLLVLPIMISFIIQSFLSAMAKRDLEQRLQEETERAEKDEIMKSASNEIVEENEEQNGNPAVNTEAKDVNEFKSGRAEMDHNVGRQRAADVLIRDSDNSDDSNDLLHASANHCRVKSSDSRASKPVASINNIASNDAAAHIESNSSDEDNKEPAQIIRPFSTGAASTLTTGGNKHAARSQQKTVSPPTKHSNAIRFDVKKKATTRDKATESLIAVGVPTAEEHHGGRRSSHVWLNGHGPSFNRVDSNVESGKGNIGEDDPIKSGHASGNTSGNTTPRSGFISRSTVDNEVHDTKNHLNAGDANNGRKSPLLSAFSMQRPLPPPSEHAFKDITSPKHSRQGKPPKVSLSQSLHAEAQRLGNNRNTAGSGTNGGTEGRRESLVSLLYDNTSSSAMAVWTFEGNDPFQSRAARNQEKKQKNHPRVMAQQSHDALNTTSAAHDSTSGRHRSVSSPGHAQRGNENVVHDDIEARRGSIVIKSRENNK